MLAIAIRVSLIVGFVLSWYLWGFLIQEINYRRGFRDDWFFWGFLSVFMGPLIAFFSLMSALDDFRSAGAATVATVVTLVVGVIGGFMPIMTLLVACLRPKSKQ